MKATATIASTEPMPFDNLRVVLIDVKWDNEAAGRRHIAIALDVPMSRKKYFKRGRKVRLGIELK